MAGAPEVLRIRFESGFKLFRKWMNYGTVAYFTKREVDDV